MEILMMLLSLPLMMLLGIGLDGASQQDAADPAADPADDGAAAKAEGDPSLLGAADQAGGDVAALAASDPSTTGADLLNGGPGADSLPDGDGADSLNGDRGNDRLAGEAGDNSLTGGVGADALSGNGAAALWGDGGDDWLQDAQGGNGMHGGAGDDFFPAKPDSAVATGRDADQIDVALTAPDDWVQVADFTPGVDLLHLTVPGSPALTLTASGPDTQVTLDGQIWAVLQGVLPDALQPGDILVLQA